MFKEILKNLGVQRVWVIDFEYEINGDHPTPEKVVCMVAKDYLSGEKIRLGPAELQRCPFRSDLTELFVPFYAIAEASCFLRLGWKVPPLWLDPWVEEKRLTNGSHDHGGSLLSAIRRIGLTPREEGHKTYWQGRIGNGEWTCEDVPAILLYCEEDVLDTERLLQSRVDSYLTNSNTDDQETALGQMLIRGRFIVECARITYHGMPVDTGNWGWVNDRFEEIKLKLIAAVDSSYGVYDSAGRFCSDLFENQLIARNIPWPRAQGSDAILLDKDTFKSMARAYPELHPLQELRATLSGFRRHKVIVDDDGRTRANLRPLSTKTGRSAPSNSRFLFGLPAWARSFLKPRCGFSLGYLDYASQEIAIGAALSGDSKMIKAYESGDPYLQFAKDAGLAPLDATKKTHKSVRSRCKQIVLGVNYGMGPDAMAARAGILVSEARELLTLHHETYRQYWSWVDFKRNQAALGLPLYSPCGWRIRIGEGQDLNERSNGNWTVQTTGSDILRIATILAADAGLKIIATVHDALFFEFLAEHAEEAARTAQRLMEDAAEAVIGIRVRVDIDLINYPDRYVDEERGADFFREVISLAQGEAHV